MKLHDSVTFGALYLLHRLKARFPAARGSSGHRLFLAAYMIASKVISDDTYSNKNGWAVVGQGMFALREINQMEREMCAYLEWQLNFEPGALKEFEEKVRRDFKGPGPYPLYEPKMPLPDPMPSTTPYNIRMGSTAPAPTFTAPSQQPPSMSPSRPMSSPVPVHAGAPPYSASSSVRAIKTYESPDYPMAISTPPVSSAHRVEVGSGRPGAQFTPFRNSSTAIAHMPTPLQPGDPYYGHEETAKLCARFVTHLFACPDLPPLSTAHRHRSQTSLQVRRDFKGFGPYPTYVLPSPAPSPMPSTTPYNAQMGGLALAPSFAARSQQQPSTSPPKPIPPPVPQHAGPPPSPRTPGTPDTPDYSSSSSSSPASSAPPSTPLGYEDLSVRVLGSGTFGTPMNIDQASPTTTVHMPGQVPMPSAATVPSSYAHQRMPAVLRREKRAEIFARAIPCVW
ncbi:hypothetical protein C8T65DRAFT_832721 [Cerioporus squamosus]|nr:hypothetical protein C8T65DRAFT_832721 [Cerioporus squamosus]